MASQHLFLLAGIPLLSLLTSAQAQTFEHPDEPERVLLLGAGVYAASNPYEGAKEDVEGGVMPFFLYETQRYTIDLSGLTVRAFDIGGFQFEGRLAPRFALVDPKDTKSFTYLDRDFGADLGLRISRDWGGLETSVEYLRDVTDRSKGQEVRFDLSSGFEPMEGLSIGVQAAYTWKDENLATWLYGIRTSEAPTPAQAYQFGQTPGAATGGVWVPSFGVQAHYQLSDKWYVFGAVEAEHLNKDITSSPLVKKDDMVAGFISLVRQF